MSFSLQAPLVSIIISNYNYGRFLKDAIRSILSQTYQNIECIIVDDCSTDESHAVLDHVTRESPHIKCIRLPKNSGQSAALLEGFSVSSGDFILFLDADDFLFEECVARHLSVHLFSRKGIGFSCCDSLQIVNGRIAAGHNANLAATFADLPVNPAIVSETPRERLKSHGIDLAVVPVERLRHISRDFRGWPWSTTSCMFFRRESLDLVCGASGLRHLRIGTDNYLAHSINLFCGSMLIDEPLVGYRIHGLNGYNKRIPLDGLVGHNKADEHYWTHMAVFQQDLFDRFELYEKIIDNSDRLFEICAFIDPKGFDPDADPHRTKEDMRPRFARLLREHRNRLEGIVGYKMVEKWLDKTSLGEVRHHFSSPDATHQNQAKLDSDSIHAIAMEVWFERRRWGLPYKVGKWLKGFHSRGRASRASMPS